MKTAKTVRTRRCLAAVAALVMMLALTGAGAEETAPAAIALNGLLEESNLLRGIPRAADKATVEAAGIVFLPGPMETGTLNEGEPYTIWQTDPDAVTFTLGSLTFPQMQFQFLEGQLLSIFADVPDAESAALVEEQLTLAYGEPMQGEDEGVDRVTDMTVWTCPVGAYELAVTLLRTVSGGPLPKDPAGTFLFAKLDVDYQFGPMP